mgnify:CR=1 FL=1
MTLRTATAVIDCKALIDNFAVIKKKAPDSQVLAVLKANAYGHGLERIAKALPQADAFGVARLDEALALRVAGVIKPIVLLEGVFNAFELPVLAVNKLQTIVHNEEQLKAITDTNLVLEEPLKVWLKIDTGMHRLGIHPKDFQYYYQSLKNSSNVHDDIVLMSHFSCADDLENSVTSAQIQLFESTIEGLANPRSFANSAAINAWPQSHYEWIRPGLMLYGVSPMTEPKPSAKELGLKPVMTLQSSLIAIREIEAGSAVGYGGAWISDKKTTIGVVAIGYGDGYPRHAVNGTPVLINGRKVPLIGKVSMDMITVDLGENSTDAVGDLVTLWGQGLAVEEVAKYATTIPYELLCNITRRVKVQVN